MVSVPPRRIKNRFGTVPDDWNEEMKKPPGKREKPQPPKTAYEKSMDLMMSGSGGLSYLPSYREYPKYLQIDEYTYLYMKYEKDLAEWYRDEAWEDLRELKDQLNGNFDKKFVEQEKLLDSRYQTIIYDKNNEIIKLNEILEKKKQLECFHEYDVAVDLDYWKKTKEQLQHYKELACGLGGFIVFLIAVLVWLIIAVG